jgi:hypothetical protein
MTIGQAYGMKIGCAFELPELAGAAGEADVVVRRGTVRPEEPMLKDEGCWFWAERGRVKLFYEGVGAFEVRGGEEMVVDPVEGADEREVRFFVLGPALAMLMQQRNLLVLHATAVRVGEEAVLFTGFSGRGKSTMAAYLCARGHELVADDVVAVDLSGARPMVRAGVPQIRLLPQSLGIVGANAAGERVHRRTDKYAWANRGMCAAGAAPMGRMYVIEDAPEMRLDQMRRHEAFGQYVSSTYPVVARLLRFTGETGKHFEQCAELGVSAGVVRLKRPRGLELLPKVAEMIEGEAGVLT